MDDADALIDTIKARANPYGLTKRELEVLRLLAEGYTDQQISSQLSISDKTAKKHVQRVRQKLGVTSRSAAVVIALREQFL